MTHDEIMKLPIEDVSEIRYVSGVIEILFHINECSFEFGVHDTNKEYYLGNVFHKPNSKPCLLCNKIWEDHPPCNVLNNKEIKSLLFERLIESNSIRLYWLYRKPRKNNKQEG